MSVCQKIVIFHERITSEGLYLTLKVVEHFYHGWMHLWTSKNIQTITAIIKLERSRTFF